MEERVLVVGMFSGRENKQHKVISLELVQPGRLEPLLVKTRKFAEEPI